MEAEKCRKYPGRSGRKGMEAKKDRKYPGTAETRGWDTKNKYSTQTKKKNMKK